MSLVIPGLAWYAVNTTAAISVGFIAGVVTKRVYRIIKEWI